MRQSLKLTPPRIALIVLFFVAASYLVYALTGVHPADPVQPVAPPPVVPTTTSRVR